MRKFVAIVEWHDGEVNDADEIVVYARSAGQARDKARRAWRDRHGRAYPAARIAEVVVFATPQFRAILASL